MVFRCARFARESPAKKWVPEKARLTFRILLQNTVGIENVTLSRIALRYYRDSVTRELIRDVFGATATGLAEQAWDRGSRHFPPKFEHKIAVNSGGRRLGRLPKRKIWLHIKN